MIFIQHQYKNSSNLFEGLTSIQTSRFLLQHRTVTGKWTALGNTGGASEAAASLQQQLMCH
jgi:hypothetical protein